MQRTAHSTGPVCGFAAVLLIILAPAAQAQSAQSEDVPEITAVVGLPFSAVGVAESVRTATDGNRFVHKLTTRHYRDGQGRTRLERDLPLPAAVAAANPNEQPRTVVTINNTVTGEIYELFPGARVASVIQRPAAKFVAAPASLPEIFSSFAGMRIRPGDPGWSAPVSLGEKSLDGLHVVGTQRVYTMPAGTVGNQKPVSITVQQWSSPDLGVVVDKTSTASTGGQLHYQLQQIVQAEPSAELFRLPAGYRVIAAKLDRGNAVAAGSSTSNTASTDQ